MRAQNLHPVTRALALILLSSVLSTCGDSAETNVLIDDRGVFGEMADAISGGAVKWLGLSTEIMASYKTMRPIIAAVLTHAEVEHDSVAATSCLRKGIGGKLYQFDGAHYNGDVDSTISQQTARFALYALRPNGLPNPLRPLGRVDISCTDSGSRTSEIEVVADSGFVASIVYSERSGDITGKFRDQETRDSLTISGTCLDFGNEVLVILSLAGGAGVNGTYMAPIISASNISKQSSLTAGLPSHSRSFLKADLITDYHGAITRGGAFFYDDTVPVLYGVACINSGTLEIPVFSRALPGCYEGRADTSVTDSQLKAISEIYQRARALWLPGSSLVEACRAVIAYDSD